MLRQFAGPHLAALVALAAAAVVMASPLEGQRGGARGLGSRLDRAADVEELLDVSDGRQVKYAKPKPVKAPKRLPKMMRTVDKGLKKANGYGAVAKKALRTPLTSKADPANDKAGKLQRMVEMAKEMQQKNKAIRKFLAKHRPSLKELQGKMKEKDAEIANLDTKVATQATTISELNALQSPVGQAAKAAAMAAGAPTKTAVSLAAAVVGAIKSQSVAKQDAAMTAGLVEAAGQLETGGDMHKAVSVAKETTVKNGGSSESAVVAAGVVVGDIKFENVPNGVAAAAAAAKETQVQGGNAMAQAKAAGVTIQRAAGTPEAAGAAAAKAASKAGAGPSEAQQAAAWSAAVTQSKYKPTRAPTPKSTPAPTPKKSATEAKPTNKPTPAPTVPPTPPPTTDGLLKYAQEELMKQRKHIAKTINQIRSELGITKVKVGKKSSERQSDRGQ